MNSDLIAHSELPVIVGLGSTGLSVARFFSRQGMPFAVVDSREDPPGLAELREEYPDIEVVLGELPARRLQQAGRLIVSPGLALTEPAIAAALEAGVPVCGDIDLFCAQANAPVAGVTGSNAKSTVTALVGAMADRAGVKAGVGGNLGTPALDLLDDRAECYILELSSFQLERAGVLGLEAATILNLSDDHLDRHGDLAHYRLAKQRIYSGCRKLVCNRDEELAMPADATLSPYATYGLSAPVKGGFGLLESGGEEWLSFQGELLMPAAELKLEGRHNMCNALAALAMGMAMDFPMDAMLAELREFSGLPHRCQLVASSGGVRYIDDSKATNPGATLAALRGLGGDHDVLLIAGGEGKGADFSVLVEEVAARCKGVILLGRDAPHLASVLEPVVPVYRATSMAGAVSAAMKLAGPDDIVLLSPACASFDMYSGFHERGQRFAQAVLAQLAEAGQR